MSLWWCPECKALTNTMACRYCGTATEFARLGESTASGTTLETGVVNNAQSTMPRHHGLSDEVIALTEQVKHLYRALAFAQSVIKSGESWTDTCDYVIGTALTDAGKILKR